jgi:dTDP-4-dehydrorhamnose reductase
MVGRAVSALCQSQGDETFAYERARLDIADAERVKAALKRDRPDVIINCAAWTDVDACESNPERAKSANAIGPEVLASTTREIGAGLITISTDYVFDGEKDGFYTQRDTPNPQSVYARSKLEGERRAQNANARTIVVRTGFIFGPGGRNFLSTIFDRAKQGGVLRAINDSYGTPTYAIDLAARLRELAARDLPGIYHVVNGGEGASYEEVVRVAVEESGVEAQIEPISVDTLNRPAPRPRNSRLQCLLSEAIGLPPLRHWKAAFRHYINSQSEVEIATPR